jgi:tetratricopeptide (TPR) repeat protein
MLRSNLTYRAVPLLAGSLLLCVAAAAADIQSDPWAMGLRMEMGSAAVRFAEMHRANPHDGQLAVGYASSLLGRQPRTARNVEEASRVLRGALASEDVEATVAARYLLARIAQIHRQPAELAAAREGFATLLADHPGHPVAEQGGVKLGTIILFEQRERPFAERLDEVTRLLAGLETPGARRGLHEALGRALALESDYAGALHHWRQVRAISHGRARRDAQVDMIVAGLALEVGELELALQHYRSFLELGGRDNRRQTVLGVVAAIEARLAQTAGEGAQ